MTAHTSKPNHRLASAGPRALRRKRTGSRAYTAVEVLMSMAVLAVGVVGIIATQKVTLASNLHAKNLAVATHIAQSWLGVLEAESALWSKDGSLARTTWLQQGSGQTDWFRPSYSTGLTFGPAFDALGNAVRTEDQDPDAKFCVDLRLSPLTSNNSGGGMMRAEVRVIWLRMDTVLGGSVVPLAHACGASSVEVPGANERRLFHFVFMSGAVRQVGI